MFIWMAIVVIYLRKAHIYPLEHSLRSKMTTNFFSSFPAACFLLAAKDRRHLRSRSQATYLILLGIMLWGLLRWRKTNVFKLWHLLVRQGACWILIVIAAEVPVLVAVCLDLDVPLNMFFQLPRIMITTIGATRMYRTLYTFGQTQDVRYVYTSQCS
ncbi:hypothetical protein OF83DRAFT_1288903 [Amylostereum chailletii]|nr:hypothetical protein OF83DRAFT_1288903 [Amylostereum chailletii]